MRKLHYAAVVLMLWACEDNETHISNGSGGTTAQGGNPVSVAGRLPSDAGQAPGGAGGMSPSDSAGAAGDVSPVSGMGGVSGDGGTDAGGAGGTLSVSAGSAGMGGICPDGSGTYYLPPEVYIGTLHLFTCKDDFCIGALDRPVWDCKDSTAAMTPICEYTMQGTRMTVYVDIELGKITVNASFTYTAESYDASAVCFQPENTVWEPPLVQSFDIVRQAGGDCPLYTILRGPDVIARDISFAETTLRLPVKFPGCALEKTGWVNYLTFQRQ